MFNLLETITLLYISQNVPSWTTERAVSQKYSTAVAIRASESLLSLFIKKMQILQREYTLFMYSVHKLMGKCMKEHKAIDKLNINVKGNCLLKLMWKKMQRIAQIYIFIGKPWYK